MGVPATYFLILTIRLGGSLLTFLGQAYIQELKEKKAVGINILNF